MAKVKCLLCPRECELMDGQRGNCRARMNIGGKLQTLVYGRPCAVHVDPVEKKPFYHFLPGTLSFSLATAGCNLHCSYCQNWEISQKNPEDTMNIELMPEEAVRQAVENNCRSIACTYSEPIVFFEYAVDIAKQAKKNNVSAIWISAGYINPEPLMEALGFLDAVKIDLKSIRQDFYKDVCKADLEPVLRTLKIIKKQGVWLEIVNLIVPTYNDTKEDFSALSSWIADNLGPDVPLHFSRFWPVYQLKNLPPTPEETLLDARNIAMSKGINYVYTGNIPEHESNNTYCAFCKKLIVERRGYVISGYNISGGKCKFCNNKIPGIWA